MNNPRWRDMQPDELQREYSPSSVIGGNYLPYLDEYYSRSLKSRAACKRVETLTYGDKPSNTIDIALPELPSACPLFVFIHGGYWQALSKNDSFFGADWFCNRGIAYAAIDYTLAPIARVTDIVAECRTAVSFLIKEAQGLGINANHLVLAGSSAGGQLCAMCCTDKVLGKLISGAVLLSGIFELEPFVGISENDAVGLTLEEAHRNSPLQMDTESFPDTIITWGEHETSEFKRQSLAMGERLQNSRRSVNTFESPSRNHFDLVHDMHDPDTLLGKAIVDMFNSL